MIGSREHVCSYITRVKLGFGEIYVAGINGSIIIDLSNPDMTYPLKIPENGHLVLCEHCNKLSLQV